MKIIVAITGATGAIYGVRILQRLREAGVETHLVISRWGARTLLHETPYSREQVESLATVNYAPGDMGAAISSGSFRTDGMVYLGDEKLRIEAVQERVRQRMETASDKRVYLRGDGTVQLQELMTIIDRLKDAGVTDVGVVARAPGDR